MKYVIQISLCKINENNYIVMCSVALLLEQFSLSSGIGEPNKSPNCIVTYASKGYNYERSKGEKRVQMN